MKVVYTGELWEGGTCLARAEALRERGWEVIPFDTTPYHSSRNHFLRSFQHHLSAGPSVKRFNRDLVSCVSQHSDADVIWIDKGRWVFASTLERIKEFSRGVLVHYTPDPAFAVHDTRHFRRGLPLYDLCITTKRYEVDAYRLNGARRVIFTWQGVDDRFSNYRRCHDITGSHRSGIVFIGHREPHYEQTLEQLALHQEELRIHGQGWEKLLGGSAKLSSCIAGSGVWGQAYAETLAGARIGIGLLSKLCPDQFTTRSFEIPATGALLLTERTPEHQQLFEEGIEAEFFSSTEELIDKAAFYLGNEQARAAIAERGYERAITSYKWGDVLSPAICEIGKLMAMAGDDSA